MHFDIELHHTQNSTSLSFMEQTHLFSVVVFLLLLFQFAAGVLVMNVLFISTMYVSLLLLSCLVILAVILPQKSGTVRLRGILILSAVADH